jgi:hypothetical protein
VVLEAVKDQTYPKMPLMAAISKLRPCEGGNMLTADL